MSDGIYRERVLPNVRARMLEHDYNCSFYVILRHIHVYSCVLLLLVVKLIETSVLTIY